MGFVGSSCDALHNAPSNNQGHNIMFDPSSPSSLQYTAAIGSPAAGHMQHNTTYALSSSSSMQHAVHQGHVMHGTTNTAGPSQNSQQPVTQRGPNREQLERFLITAPIEQLRRRLWESFHGLSERNKEHRALQTSFQASEKRREELEQENSELRQQLNAKTLECENVQTFMGHDFLHTMQAELEPRLEGLNNELSNRGTALNAKTQECDQLRWGNAVMAGLAQQAMPPRMSDREVIESFAPMNGADVHGPLPSTLPDIQRDGQPTGLIYPAPQPSAYENNGYTRASNEGLQDMTPTGNTYSSPLIDLTEEKPEALEQDSGATTNQSGDRGSTFTSTSSHRSSDASVTTFNSSEQSASASSPQVDSHDPANVGNQLKRGAGTDLVGTVKKPRQSDYSWLQGTGNPAKANDDWTKVRGGVPQDGRSSYLFNQDNEWEKRKKKYEIRCKKDGVDPKKRPFEAVEQKPSVQRAKDAAQRSEAKKRVPKAKAPRPAPSAVSTGTPQIDTAEHPVAEASETTQFRDQQCSKSQTVISDEDDDIDGFAAELEAELAQESEVHVDEATAGQAPDEDEDMDAYAAELEAELERESEDKVDHAIVEQFTDAAEPIPDGFLPCDETDQDSLFGGDMDDPSADDKPKPKDQENLRYTNGRLDPHCMI